MKRCKEDKDFNLEIVTEDITDIHFGFDAVLTVWEDRAAPWNKPLRVRYKSKEGEKAIYLFVNFHHKYEIRTSDMSVTVMRNRYSKIIQKENK